jgi:organic hydroperoxide reductase OsmC/OhrA
MAVKAKEFSYEVTLEDGGRLLADGGSPVELPEEWTGDHLVLAGLVDCSLVSLAYHAQRAGRQASGRGTAHAKVTKRESDGRYAIVELTAQLEVAVEPDADDDVLAELLEKAERDCFVGASLTVKPTYRWTVNGRVLSARAAPS